MKPEFMKIYVPRVCSKHMKVPRDFVKHLDVDVPKKFKLHRPAKGPWYVKPQKIGDDLFFTGGWEGFVEDNGLVYGDVLVFKYEGGSNFRVAIYGKNGVENEHGLSVDKCEAPLSSEEDEDSEESDVKSKALEEAEGYVSASKYPCFLKVMRASYLTNRYLAIPCTFLRGNIKRREVEVLLQVGRKKWPVTMFFYDKKEAEARGRMYAGWKKFANENQLQEDDVCVFELIRKTKDHVLKVSIFREH